MELLQLYNGLRGAWWGTERREVLESASSPSFFPRPSQNNQEDHGLFVADIGKAECSGGCRDRPKILKAAVSSNLISVRSPICGDYKKYSSEIACNISGVRSGG